MFPCIVLNHTTIPCSPVTLSEIVDIHYDFLAHTVHGAGGGFYSAPVLADC